MAFFLRTTTITRGGTDTTAQKVISGEENSSAAPARIRTRNLSITSSALLLLGERKGERNGKRDDGMFATIFLFFKIRMSDVVFHKTERKIKATFSKL